MELDPSVGQGGFVTRAKRAGAIVLLMLAAMWLLEGLDPGHTLLRYGILPRDVGTLPDIFSAPFLHLNYAHLMSNSLPLLVLGFFAALRGLARFVAITLIIIVASGLGV